MESFVQKRKRKHTGSECGSKEQSEAFVKNKKTKSDVILERICPSAENLRIEYALLYNKSEADSLIERCENELKYNEGDLTKVFVFGKWHSIPRKQVFHSDCATSLATRHSVGKITRRQLINSRRGVARGRFDVYAKRGREFGAALRPTMGRGRSPAPGGSPRKLMIFWQLGCAFSTLQNAFFCIFFIIILPFCVCVCFFLHLCTCITWCKITKLLHRI